jgi:hypothetical protein
MTPRLVQQVRAGASGKCAAANSPAGMVHGWDQPPSPDIPVIIPARPGHPGSQRKEGVEEWEVQGQSVPLAPDGHRRRSPPGGGAAVGGTYQTYQRIKDSPRRWGANSGTCTPDRLDRSVRSWGKGACVEIAVPGSGDEMVGSGELNLWRGREDSFGCAEGALLSPSVQRLPPYWYWVWMFVGIRFTKYFVQMTYLLYNT